MMVVATLYMRVNFEIHKREIEDTGFVIEKAMITENEGYGKYMTMYLSNG